MCLSEGFLGTFHDNLTIKNRSQKHAHVSLDIIIILILKHLKDVNAAAGLVKWVFMLRIVGGIDSSRMSSTIDR